MGFWARDRADLNDYWQPPIRLPKRVEPAQTFRCTMCAYRSADAGELIQHQRDVHVRIAPTLYFRGVACGQTRLTISTETQPEDWGVSGFSDATINDTTVKFDDVPYVLTGFRQRYVDVVLHGVANDLPVRLQFDVAEEADLAGVEACMARTVEHARLDRRAIDEFIDASSRHRSATTYRDGIAQYMYGVLARERSPETDLPHEAYRGRFEHASAVLRPIQRPVAQSIVGLVAFHFNQFDQIPDVVESTRLGQVSRRILACLDGQRLPEAPLPPMQRSALMIDTLFSDADTEQILRWWTAGRAVTDAQLEMIQHRLGRADALDVPKLHILAGELSLSRGNHLHARQHANELRNNQLANRWASSMLDALQ